MKLASPVDLDDLIKARRVNKRAGVLPIPSHANSDDAAMQLN